VVHHAEANYRLRLARSPSWPPIWLHRRHCRRRRVVFAVERRGQSGLCAGPL